MVLPIEGKGELETNLYSAALQPYSLNTQRCETMDSIGLFA